MNNEFSYYPFEFIFTDFLIETPPKNYLHKNILNKYNYYYEEKSSHEVFQTVGLLF